jgi:replication factor C large subunit
MLWLTKHAPKKTADVPQPAAARLLQFLRAKPMGKALLIHGPPGSCKTAAVYAAVAELGLDPVHDVLEVNASDFRNAELIRKTVGQASVQRSLFGSTTKVILVDEVDNLSGTKDRGGVSELVKLIQGSAFPIVLTANDIWDKKLSGLRAKCETLEFPQLSPGSILGVLLRVCAAEGIAADPGALKSLALRAGGDLRAVLLDLQTLAASGQLHAQGIDALGSREREEGALAATALVLKTTDPKLAVAAFDNVDEDPESKLQWVDENLPREYTRAPDLCRAYESLSRADLFNARIRRRQHWHFLAVMNALATAGVAVAKDARYGGFTKLSQPQRGLQRWRLMSQLEERKALAEQLGKVMHCSQRKAYAAIPEVLAIAEHQPGLLEALQDASG